MGAAFAAIAALLSFALSLISPHFLNMFWQVPDGMAILDGHFPATVSYAIASGPLVNQEWLFEVAIALAVRTHQYGLFVLLCAVAAAVAPLLAYAFARTCGCADVPAGIAAFLVLGTRFTGSALRAETFAVDAFALTLIVVFGRRSVWWIAPVVVFWANVHASVLLAPAVIALAAAAQWLAARQFDAQVRRYAIGATIAFAAMLVTPYGPRLVSYAVNLTIGGNPVRQVLDAWAPWSFGNLGDVMSVVPGVAILVVCGVSLQRRNVAILAIAAALLLMALRHGRYATFLCIAWAPVIAQSLERATYFRTLAARAPGASLLALAPLVLFAVFPIPRALATPAEPRGAWNAGADMVRAHGLHGNTYAPYVWAAYLAWQRLPVRLLIDGHGDPYPADVWADYEALEHVRPDWQAVLDRRQIDIVLVAADSPLSAVMRLAPGWQRVDQRDGVAAFSRRPPPKNG